MQSREVRFPIRGASKQVSGSRHFHVQPLQLAAGHHVPKHDRPLFIDDCECLVIRGQ